MTERSSFGPELRRAREARGLTLEEIAEQTKVSATLYRGLENNDLSRWPSGLFRRAFVRNYARAVGLDPEETCRRFVRLFPEEGDAVPEMHAVPPPPAPPAPPSPQAVPVEAPRLVLAAAPTQPGRMDLVGRRLAAGLVDVGLAGVPAAIAGLLAGPSWFWMVAAAGGAIGHLAALAAWGRTPGARLLLGGPLPGRQDDAVQEARRRAETEGPVLIASRRPAPVARPAARRGQGRR